MIPALYISVASCFAIKVIIKSTAFVSSFKSEKGDTAKSSSTDFIYKQKRQIHVPLNCKRIILNRNAKFLEFWFQYQSNHVVVF